MWHCTPCISSILDPGRPSGIFILFLFASLKAKGLKLILGRNRLNSGYRTALPLLIFVGAFIEPAGYELLACWLFNSDLCLFLSLLWRLYVTEWNGNMIKNGTGLKGGILGLLLKIILEFAWSDRQTCRNSDVIQSTLTSYYRQPNRLWVAHRPVSTCCI